MKRILFFAKFRESSQVDESDEVLFRSSLSVIFVTFIAFGKADHDQRTMGLIRVVTRTHTKYARTTEGQSKLIAVAAGADPFRW